MDAADPSNPFPGLRPFAPEEDHLFFGREKEIDELLRRLRTSRFLAVIGSSGSGKSSLVCCGLIPSLHSGIMVNAGSSWRVSIFRPGKDPIGNMAAALNAPDVLGTGGELADTSRVLLEATLRRGSLGLVEAVRQARIPPDDNLLVVVDQFEELFRFRRNRNISNPRAEATFFVNLLLEASGQSAVPIYLVLTMRSDFIGDCMEYLGLPEAVNAGQYLVPRMTRDELRSAITGPVAVGGGEIAPRAVLRLLNDVGEDPDQLPVLQHALMRTWDHWQGSREEGEPIDIRHYEAIGTMREALSLHADEAFLELPSEGARQIAEILFKALTDTFSDSRGLRRPTSVQEVAAIAGVPESEVIQVVETFRRPGRTFVMPPAGVPIGPATILDLSHESLMRVWRRLVAWAEEERVSARQYARLARAAAWHEEGTAGLWRDPELELGLQWRRQTRPGAAWARRYDPSFDRAMRFLDASEADRNRILAREEAQRRAKLRQAWWAAGILAALLVVAAGSAVYAWRQQIHADNQRLRADENLDLARKAVDEMLASAGRKSARMAAELPEVESFRRELLEKARDFYARFSLQKPESEEFRREIAVSHARLGDIYRLLQKPEDAGGAYREAIASLEALARDYPARPEYRQLLGNTWNWLGETLRPLKDRQAEAEEAYGRALVLQQALAAEMPQNPAYRQELARSHYNRGILRADAGDPDDADYREAIRLLEPLAAQGGVAARQELARACNNLGLLMQRSDRPEQGRESFEKAIGIHEELVRDEPSNREYRLELAKFCSNLGILAQQQGALEEAKRRSLQALDLLEELARPVPSVGIELAHTRNLRGRLLEEEGFRSDAGKEYAEAVGVFAALEEGGSVAGLPEFHMKYGEALYNLALWQWQGGDSRSAIGLLTRAVEEHSAAPDSMVNLAYDYMMLAQIHDGAGSRARADEAAGKLEELLAGLPAGEKDTLTQYYEQWRKGRNRR